MGFNEYQRIRNKNYQYNFPSTEVNFQARQCIKKLNLTGASLIEKLNNMLSGYDHPYTKDVIKTAIRIAKQEQM